MDVSLMYKNLLVNNKLTDIDCIKTIYRLVLLREAEEEALKNYEDQIKQGTFNYVHFVYNVFDSIEYKMVKSNFNYLVHSARVAFVSRLNKFDNILDIGGSSPNIAEGALIELGYSHRPKRITILDLPEEEQYWGKPKFPQDKKYVFEWGELSYEHGKVEFIEKISDLSDKKFDLVFMGQVIEHIEQGDLFNVLKWIKNHLNKNGRFIFDTPNRRVTKMINPLNFIDADHKYEYEPSELRKILNECKFEVLNEIGLVSLKNSVLSNIFDPTEIIGKELLNDICDESYIFAFECK